MDYHASPLRYPGGKSALANLLADVLVENDLHNGTFVEPFAGGAGAALRLLFDEYVTRIVLNDVDPNIYAFWRAALNQTDALARRVRRARVSIRQWKLQQGVYLDAPRDHSQLDVAYATFFLNRCNRSGVISGGGPIGGYDQDGPWKLDARFNRTTLANRIERVARYRDRISVSKLDAVTLLKALNDSRTLVYLDPPYYEKGQKLYLNALEHSYHERLAAFLLTEPPFRWVLTYDDTPVVRELYRSLSPIPFALSYSAYERRTGRELLIADPRLMVRREMLATHGRQGKLFFDVAG